MDIETEVLREFGIAIHRKPTRIQEGELVWHSGCPFEGAGSDRMSWFERGNYYCRSCGAKGFLKATPQRTPQEIAEFSERQKLEEEIWHKRRLDNLAKWKSEGHEKEVWQWHKNNHREYWVGEGVPEWAVDKYQFGYCEAKSMRLKTGELVALPTYTMPIWEPAKLELVNIQYRLCDPPPGEGKYRQESVIPAAAAFMNDDYEDQAIFVEGFKKAVIIYDFIDFHTQVVGFPSNLPSAELLKAQCNKFKKIYLIWDPRSDNQVRRMGRLMSGRVWAITLPVKPDDAVTKYNMTQATFRSYFAIAERLK